ncbi:hypothetical protein B0H13DRAFT_2483905 [Mycena leptocephala]|nr:hypothetical protein B0H13DRAFT_2483905 [Mycena leptocephala]
MPIRPALRFVRAPYFATAHISVWSDENVIVIDRLTGLICKYHRQIRVALSPKHLPDVMDCIAHFNYFLKHANEEENNTLVGQFALEMHRLMGNTQRKPDPGQDGNMLKNGEARFAPEAGAKYGFTIYNTSRAYLFPYRVYFDSHKYTIQLIYAPEGPTVQAPLKSGQSLMFTFPEDLREGSKSSSGFLKLLVAVEYINLEWIQQTLSSFDSSFSGASEWTRTVEKLLEVKKLHELKKLRELTWDALTVTLTMVI